jgi:hypothetical protein
MTTYEIITGIIAIISCIIAVISVIASSSIAMRQHRLENGLVVEAKRRAKVYAQVVWEQHFQLSGHPIQPFLRIFNAGQCEARNCTLTLNGKSLSELKIATKDAVLGSTIGPGGSVDIPLETTSGFGPFHAWMKWDDDFGNDHQFVLDFYVT